MWTILIIILSISSIILSIKNKFSYYKIDLKSLLKKDKTSLFLALATKIGVGSLIGTTSSIIIGGFSSVIWILIFSLISIPFIYYESKISKEYSTNHIGGVHITLKRLNKKYISIISITILIILYSFLFQMIQINTLYNTLPINKNILIILIGVILIITVNLNIKETLKIINKIVPFKCAFFVLISLLIICSHIRLLCKEFYLIVGDLFSLRSVMSGFIIGCKRSIFMNEVLIGTSGISSSSDNNDINDSIKYQVIGVYFITFVLTILISSIILIYKSSNTIIDDYNTIVLKMYEFGLGKFGVFSISVILILFAFTTILSGYYILECNVKNKKLFKILFILIILSGSFINNNVLWKYTDTLMFIMIIINSYSIIKVWKVHYDRKRLG